VVFGADIPHRRLRPTDQDQKQALGDRRLGQIFFGKSCLRCPAEQSITGMSCALA
jgi:hypothetical protein